MGHWWTFITLWPALSNPTPAQIVPKDSRSVRNPRDQLSLSLSLSPYLSFSHTPTDAHTQWEVDRPGWQLYVVEENSSESWTEPSSGQSQAATATVISACVHVQMFIYACARHIFSNASITTLSRKGRRGTKISRQLKQTRTGWNSQKICLWNHPVAFKWRLDALQFIAVRRAALLFWLSFYRSDLQWLCMSEAFL